MALLQLIADLYQVANAPDPPKKEEKEGKDK